jgi:hypothetical protein
MGLTRRGTKREGWMGKNNQNDSQAETVGQSLSRSQIDTFFESQKVRIEKKLKQNQIKPKGLSGTSAIWTIAIMVAAVPAPLQQPALSSLISQSSRAITYQESV